MAGSLTNWGENAVLDTVFGQSTEFSTGLHTNYWWGLTTGTPTDTGNSTNQGECAGSTYKRKSQANSSASWANSTGGIKLLKASVTITTAAGSDWGTIRGITLNSVGTSAKAGGHVIVWSTITGGAKVVNVGDSIVVSTGFSVTLT